MRRGRLVMVHALAGLLLLPLVPLSSAGAVDETWKVTRVSASSTYNADPEFAIVPEGGVVAVWRTKPSSAGRYSFDHVGGDATGTSWGNPGCGLGCGHTDADGDVPGYETVDVEVAARASGPVYAWIERYYPDPEYAASRLKVKSGTDPYTSATIVDTDAVDVELAAGDASYVVAYGKVDPASGLRQTAYDRSCLGCDPIDLPLGEGEEHLAFDVAMDAEGNAIVLWVSRKDGLSHVNARYLPDGGSPADHLDLSGPVVSLASSPQVAVGAPGEFIITLGTSVTAYARVSDGTFSSVQAPAELPPGIFSGGLADDGTAFMLIEDPGDDTWQLFRLSSGATTWVLDKETYSAGISDASLAVGPNGEVGVTWTINSTTERIMGAVRNPAGTWVAWQTVSDTSATAEDASVYAAAGRVFIAFRQYAGDLREIRVAAFLIGVPKTTMTKPTAAYSTSLSIPVAWTATDSDGISAADLRVRSASFSSGFSLWSLVKNHVNASSFSYTGKPGRNYCFEARSYDTTGVVGAYSASRCTVTPIDERALTSKGFAAVSSSKAFQGTLRRTKTKGATLTSALYRGYEVALLVQKGPGFGKIEVRYAGALLGTYSLAAAAVRNRVVLLIKPIGLTKTGRVTIKVVTSGKPVAIDGLYVRKRPE